MYSDRLFEKKILRGGCGILSVYNYYKYRIVFTIAITMQRWCLSRTYLVYVCVSVVTFYLMTSRSYVIHMRDGDEQHTALKHPDINIIVYHPFQWRLMSMIKSLKMDTCLYNNCSVQLILVKISGTVEDADAVVFQGNRMPKGRIKRRDPQQVFVFLNNEPPNYVQLTNLSMPYFKNYFNWTMTYRNDSDIPMPYGAIIPREYVNNEMAHGKNYSAIYRSKTKSALWIVSHCHTTSNREKYVDAMANHTTIDQFGQCNNNNVQRSIQLMDQLSSQYKFYLALENSLCRDYVTEKAFDWFARDVVIVVRGGCDYVRVLPKGTYIDAGNFDTPVALAKYLTELAANENEYIEYLRRKDTYYVVKEQEMVQKGFCTLCERLNNVNQYRKYIENIHRWWQVDACWNPSDV